MIAADKRQAVWLLHQEGMSVREMTRRLHLSRNTVRSILEQKGEGPVSTRRAKVVVEAELLERLYQECEGRVQRVHEKLKEEEGLAIPYSTLARRVRQLGLNRSPAARCGRVPDVPGAEMQHDTSPYKISLGDTRMRLIASLLYLRYSKRRYLRFYRRFNRFRMKCFLHEALMFWGYAARECIIDNTNLARWKGTGRDAVMMPEMEAFARQYGFRFVCHEKGHANRKAGEERSFYTLETNFFPGRRFQTLEDLNQQAREWATVRMEQRPVAKSRLIPAQAFEQERQVLVPLPAHLPPPYRAHERGIDQYGYIPFSGNYYWVPGTRREDREDVKVLEYSDRLKIYQNRKCVVEYVLPAADVTNHLFSPEGMPKPERQPKDRRRSTTEEEKRLRALAPSVESYLSFALPAGAGIPRHRFLRRLFALAERLPRFVFLEAIERALRYRIPDLVTFERIARLALRQGEFPLPEVEVEESFEQREAFQEGRLTDAPDFSAFEEEEDDDDG